MRHSLIVGSKLIFMQLISPLVLAKLSPYNPSQRHPSHLSFCLARLQKHSDKRSLAGTLGTLHTPVTPISAK